jgi:arsenate reductase
MSDITIYHNPACGTSRNVLGLIRNSGVETTVIEYVKTPPSRETLLGLIGATGVSVREVLRIKGTPYEELGLDLLSQPQRGAFTKEDGQVADGESRRA